MTDEMMNLRAQAREKAQALKRKGDLHGHQVWMEVAREIEHPTATSKPSDS